MPSPSVRTRKMYYRVGTRVRIVRCCCRESCTKHELATGNIVKIDRRYGTRCPVIQLDDFNKVLWGFECWWTTERIHQQVLREHGGSPRGLAKLKEGR